MCIWIKIFFSTFFLSDTYAVTESIEFPANYTFAVVSLGHSGLLITWNPQKEVKSESFFTFNAFIAEEENYGNSPTSDNRERISFPRQNNLCSEKNRDSRCGSRWGSYKIHSLNESTRYEIIIEQYDFSEVFRRKYSMKIKTNPKSQRKPVKPDFEHILSKKDQYIRWYPCGRGRIYKDLESGTHFGVKIKELYNLRKANEAEKEEFLADSTNVFLLPGRIYEIVVYSINGEYKTYSDSQEIFLNPAFPTVQHVKIISLPDLSVFISWEPPKRAFKDQIFQYRIFPIQHFNEPHTTDERDIIFYDHTPKQTHKIYRPRNTNTFSLKRDREQIRIFNCSLGVVYTYMIIPLDWEQITDRIGFEYWTRHEVQAYDHNLPIAKPDFIYILEERGNGTVCFFYFQWLPCGQSFDCEGTKPGSNYSFQFRPEPRYKYEVNDIGCIQGMVDWDRTFEVSLKSSIGGNFSESVTKKFKNCTAI